MLKIIFMLSTFLAGATANRTLAQSHETFSRIQTGKHANITIVPDSESFFIAEMPNAETKISRNTLYIADGQRVETHVSSLEALRLGKGAVACVQPGVGMDELTLSLGPDAIISGRIEAKGIDLHAASGAVTNLELTTGKLVVDASAKTNLRLAGYAALLQANLKADAFCHAEKLELRLAELSAESQSEIRLLKADKIVADLDEGARLVYRSRADAPVQPASAIVLNH